MVGFLNEYGRAWFEGFGLMVVQNTVFLGVVFAALYRLRGASARVRYAVATTGLVKLVIPPFLPARVSNGISYIELPALPVLSDQPAARTAEAATGAPAVTLAGLLLAIWCAVAAGVLIHAVVTTWRLSRALEHAEDAVDDDSDRLARRNGVRVRVTDVVPVPMTVGMFPSTIFVPPQWNRWTSPGRRAVLRHEMAHIRHHDGLVRALETFIHALYWFHPLVFLLLQRLDTYREQACDEKAAAPDPEGRIAYSQQLVEIAEHLLERSVRGSASALLRRRNQLIDRVHYLTREGSAMKLNKVRMVALVLGLAVAITSLSWYNGTAEAPKPSKDHAATQVTLQSGGAVRVNGRSVKLEEVGDAIKNQIDDPDAVVTIVCDEDVPMRTLFLVHGILRETGMLKVRYAGTHGAKMPLVLPSKKLIEKTRQIPADDIVELKVDKGGKCMLDGVKVEPSMIQEEISKRLTENEYLIVSLSMAEDATYGQYLQTLKALEKAKAKRIFIKEPSVL